MPSSTAQSVSSEAERAELQAVLQSQPFARSPDSLACFPTGVKKYLQAGIRNLNILQEAGENRPLLRQISGLEPNAQGKLLLEFVPVNHYATISAIEVVPQ